MDPDDNNGGFPPRFTLVTKADCNDSSSSSRSRCGQYPGLGPPNGRSTERPVRKSRHSRSRHGSVGTYLNDSGISGSTGGEGFQMTSSVSSTRFAPLNSVTSVGGGVLQQQQQQRLRSKSLRHYSRSSAEIQDALARDEETPTPPPPPPPMLPSDFPGTLPRGHHIAPPPQPRQILPNNVQGFTFYDNKLSHKFQFTTPSSTNGGGGGATRMGSLGALHGSRSPPPDIPPPPVPHVGGTGFILNNKVQNQLSFKQLETGSAVAGPSKYVDSKPSLIV